MAAAVSSSSAPPSAWGVKSKPGAWALEAEQHDEDLQSSVAQSEPPSSDFPSLAAAAATKTKKKKKPPTLSLAEFSTFTPSALHKPDAPLALPTGPRERSAEELERSRSGFGGGGFRSYGQDSANPRARASDRNDEGFSRADEADDWSKAKRLTGAADRREKVGFFNSSRADEVDNWASRKPAFAPTEPRRDRRMGFETSSNGADSDTWTRAPRLGFESSAGGAADSENWLKKKEGNVGGPRPRISLQPRTLPVNVVSGHGNGGVVEVKASPKGLNPFGDARPREEVLKGKGQDWKEIDEKLEAFKLKEEPPKEAANPWRRNDGLMAKKTWRKDETDAVSADKVDNGDTEDNAAKDTENGEPGNN